MILFCLVLVSPLCGHLEPRSILSEIRHFFNLTYLAMTSHDLPRPNPRPENQVLKSGDGS